MKGSLGIFAACFILLQGCIPLFIGAGVLTGYVLSNDSASGNVKADYEKLWSMCEDTLDYNRAEIISTDESRGLIKSKIKEHSVTLQITSITENVQKLRVSARKYLLPKPQFAQKIFFDIIDELR
ncbi:MAG: DUF3568 family protein [Candidatus Omnitrophica bacterium]|nr:DUF3568 family protein [Candidatus Omnitrophota bacterium]MBD3268929.1 DUF3568 family protein [Candidatus Omnitrophota bacterium]